MDVQEGEAAEETQGTLRRAVCADHVISAQDCIERGLAHGKRSRGSEDQIEWGLASILVTIFFYVCAYGS